VVTLEDRPAVEIVEEMPSLEDERERAFVAGAIISGLLAAAVGFTVGFICGAGAREQEP